MTGKRRLTKSLDNLNTLKQGIVREFPGILGAQFKGQTLVDVPNRDGYVYVRLRSDLDEIIQAYNSMVSPVFGLPVVVTRDETHNRYIVKGRDLGQYQNWGSSAYLPRHGAQHSFPDNGWGGDIVWVYDRQFVPLSIAPVSGSSAPGSVYVYPDIVYWGGVWMYVGAVISPDLLGFKPTDDQAILIMAYLDIYGVVQYVSGSVFGSAYASNSEIVPFLPMLPPDGAFPLGAVRLVSGTTSLSYANIYDLRPIIGGGNAGYMGGHTIQDEGVSLTQRTKLNFKGNAIWAEDNPGTTTSDINVSGTYVMQSDTPPSGTFPGMLWMQPL
jgi:hypothetical protein